MLFASFACGSKSFTTRQRIEQKSTQEASIACAPDEMYIMEEEQVKKHQAKMFSTVTTVFIIIVSAVSISAVPAPTSPCAAVHIIAARASTELPGAGIIGALVAQVRTQSRQTVSTVAVDYPATLTNYASSSAEGTAATKTLLNNQAAACPNQKIVLVGYSQVSTMIHGDNNEKLSPSTREPM